MSSKSSTPSPVTGITPKSKKRPRGGQFGAAGVEHPSVRRSKVLEASKARSKEKRKRRYKKKKETEETEETENEHTAAIALASLAVLAVW